MTSQTLVAPDRVPAPRLARITGWLRSGRVGPALVVLALALLSWPITAGKVDGTLDASWRIALHLAVQRDLDFGSGIIFTYGPLGFLGSPWPWLGPTTLLALAFAAAVYTTLAVIVYVGARRLFPVWAAIPVAYLAMRLAVQLQVFEAFESAVLAGCIVAILRRDRLSPRWAAALGLVAAVAILGKLNIGMLVVGYLAVTTVTLAGVRRGLVPFAAVFAAAALALWLLTGQPLTGIADYLRWALEVIRGYSDAMSADRNTNWHWLVFAFLGLVGLLVAYAWDEALPLSRLRRVGLVLIVAAATFGFFKSSVVRNELNYAFGAVIVLVFALAKPGPRLQFAALATAAAFAMMAVIPTNPPTLVDFLPNVRAAVKEAAVGLRPWTWSTALGTTEQALQAGYQIPPDILAAVGTATVHIDPHDTGVAAAYPQLAWQPLPMFQAYSSYTSALDELNASVLTGPNAPQRILREGPHPFLGTDIIDTQVVDKRDRWFDGPAAMLQSFCRYDEIAATARWEVLALNPARACGTPVPLGSVTAALGATVKVPAAPQPGEIVIVKVHGVGSSPLDRVLSTVFHAPEWYATVNGTEFRMVPGTAVDGLILSVPASIHRSPGFMPDTVTTLSITNRTRLPWQGALTYEFLAVPVTGG